MTYQFHKNILSHISKLYEGAMYIIPWCMPKILKGAGSILQLPEFLKKKKLSNILIVT